MPCAVLRSCLLRRALHDKLPLPAQSFSGDTACIGELRAKNCRVSAVVRAEAPRATQLVRAEAQLLVGCGTSTKCGRARPPCCKKSRKSMMTAASEEVESRFDGRESHDKLLASAAVRAEAARGWPKHAGCPRATKLCPALSFSCSTACRGEHRAKNCPLVLVRAEAPWATRLLSALSCEAACRGELCTTNCPLARLCELRRAGACMFASGRAPPKNAMVGRAREA